jgi:hypothetical protein
VSIGSHDGHFLACGYATAQGGTLRCHEREATTLEAMDEALISTPVLFPGAEVEGNTQMLGQQARFEHPEYVNNGLGAGSTYNVYLLHDGRPVALTFDWWNIRFARLGDGAKLVGAIVESFRLLEE